jgi:glycosyltransferase involved in cell wall biosynthesis
VRDQRIVFVEFAPSGGLFQFSVQLADALAVGGEDVHVITGRSPEIADDRTCARVHASLPTWHPGDPARPPAPWLRRVRRGTRALRHVVAWSALIPILCGLRPTVVVWSAWRFGLDAALVVLLKTMLPSAKQVIIAHEPGPSNPRDTTDAKSGPVFDRLFAAAWRRMDVVFVLGEGARNAVLRRWSPQNPVRLMPHGDEGWLRRSGHLTDVADTRPVALFFGTWTYYKGLDTLLDAFAIVRERVETARLVIAGAVGDDVDVDVVLSRAAEIGGVEARPGYVPSVRVHDLLDRARVVVLPYRTASQSGVAHLAFTFGRPVVATDVGDLSSVVLDGTTGYLVGPERPDLLAERLVRLMTDASLAERLGGSGRDLVSATSSWAAVAQVFRQGIGATPSPRGRRSPAVSGPTKVRESAS